MRYVYSALAVVFCLVAIAGRAFDWGGFVVFGALVLAALMLVLTMRQRQGDQPGKDRPLVLRDLDESQRAELARLLDQGQFGTAVKQVRLWFKYVSADDAEAVVRAISDS